MSPVLHAEHVSYTVAAAVRSEEATGARLKADAAAAQLEEWRAGLPSRLTRALPLLKNGGMDNCPAACSRPGTAVQGFEVWLELVEECNLNCLFCYNPWRGRPTPTSNRPAHLPLRRTAEVLDIICAATPVRHLTISGGEPLMYPQLPTLVSRVAGGIPSIGITTNGRSGTRARLEALKASGVTQVGVPIHSHSAQVHDRLVAGRSWHAAIRCLALAQEAGLETVTSAVVTRVNWSHIPKVAEIALLLGIPRLVLNCFHPTGQGLAHEQELTMADGLFEDVVRAAQETFGNRLEIVIGSPPASGTPARTSHPERPDQITRLVLSPAGELKFCNQSETGLLNVLECEEELLSTVLADLASGRHDNALASIRGCSCRDRP